VTPFHIKRSSFIASALFGTVFVAVALAAPVAVPTYHYDTYRTGWNQQETTLSASNFPSTFGIVSTVALDDQVDAQPLLVPGLTIAGGTHDVIYVATESNTVYAIDALAALFFSAGTFSLPYRRPALAGFGPDGLFVGRLEIVNVQHFAGSSGLGKRSPVAFVRVHDYLYGDFLVKG
jgi:hypothetical protein